MIREMRIGTQGETSPARMTGTKKPPEGGFI